MRVRPMLQPAERVRLLCDFANTLDVDVDADPPDALLDPGDLQRWLAERDLVQGASAATVEDLELAHLLRAGIRSAMQSHCRGDSSYVTADLDAVGQRLPLTVVFGGATPHLAPARGGVQAGLSELLIGIMAAAADATWTRYKLCTADECALAFYDRSKNQARRWCSMGECGNRQKARAYRARHQPTRR